MPFCTKCGKAVAIDDNFCSDCTIGRMSLVNQLPAPQHDKQFVVKRQTNSTAIVDPNALVPPYGSRTNYLPRKPEDYGDGGAFPEIHIKQYPLEMGRKRNASGNALQLRIDKNGEPNFDVVVRQGQRKGKHIFSAVSEMEAKQVDEDKLQRPNSETTQKSLDRVRNAIQKKLQIKVKATQPGGQRSKTKDGVFVRYTSADQNSQHNSGAKSRIIKLHKMQVDPLEPPKFRHKKLPAGPGSPPVPIMHSPPRSITQEDQKNWKIPPCVSNWKNNRGYAIPLHQRLATSGRGLEDNQINDGFASLTQALYYAERTLRERVESNARDRKQKNDQLVKQREKDLKRIAEETRNRKMTNIQREVETPASRAASQTPSAPTPSMGTPSMGTPSMGTPSMGTPSMGTPSIGTPSIGTPSTFDAYGAKTPSMRDIGTPGSVRDPATPGFENVGLSVEDIEARNERQRLREEAKRRRKRKMGLEKSKGVYTKKDRDISEQIALGQNVAQTGGESLYDQRLFNRDSGISHGFGVDDAYSIYDRPMNTTSTRSLYRPTKTDDAADEDEIGKILSEGPKFQPHKGFKGTDEPHQRTDGPVQFEKVRRNEDPFDLQEMSSKEKPRRERKSDSSRRKRRRSPSYDREESSPKRKKKKKKRN